MDQIHPSFQPPAPGRHLMHAMAATSGLYGSPHPNPEPGSRWRQLFQLLWPHFLPLAISKHGSNVAEKLVALATPCVQRPTRWSPPGPPQPRSFVVPTRVMRAVSVRGEGRLADTPGTVLGGRIPEGRRMPRLVLRPALLPVASRT